MYMASNTAKLHVVELEVQVAHERYKHVHGEQHSEAAVLQHSEAALLQHSEAAVLLAMYMFIMPVLSMLNPPLNTVDAQEHKADVAIG
jgi:hypothetical protein